MPGPIDVQPGVTIPEAELRWRFSRSRGPGGQSVNTSDTRVELSWDVAATQVLPADVRARAVSRLAGRLAGGVVTVTASEHRSQLRNRSAAEQRLAEVVRAAIAPPPARRRPTRPTKGSVRRRLDSKRKRGEVKRLRRGTDD